MLAALLLLAGCIREEPEMPSDLAPEGTPVQLSFKVAVPCDNPDTKTMGTNPTIDPNGFYIAVFGGSGYFNEWVKATVVQATANYDPSNPATLYTINATISISDSRLRLHFIANCPTALRSSPPISGSMDTEENVLSKIRSQRTESYNDGYWQKIILPNGVKATKSGNNYVATPETMAQFPDPIILVRNFARVYLRNLTPLVGTQGVNEHHLVTIKKFALAYAPAEGVIAPILSNPYTSNSKGRPIPEPADDDDETPVYFENFFMNYQRYGIDSTNPADTLVTSAPFNYEGFSPSNQSYDYYPAAGHSDRSIPVLSDMQVWDNSNPQNNVLYVYERTMPSSDRRATRIIILAERIDQNDVSDGEKYYALDIVNTEGVAIPILRNQSYTVHLLDIEAGSGETDITKASKASSATVSGDPTYQDLINISDGKSSIGTSFTEKFYVQPQLDSVMFRYIPTNITDETYEANKEGNELVTIKVGTVNTNTGVFTELTPSQASSQGVLAFKTQGSGYRVWISKDNSNNVIQYVRQNNAWVAATQAQIDNPAEEKWGMIYYELNESYKDSENYFTQERTQAIHVTGSYNGREMSRNVIIKTSPRQEIRVTCQQKYVMAATGQTEVVRIMIPTGLSRSVFPLDFTIEPNGYSLTPDGDSLPVDFGTSTDPNNSSPAFYYVKSLTEAQYKALPTTSSGGKTWNYFDCHFKTTVPQNACTIYVHNHYFNDAYAYDLFYNYAQREFSSLAFTPTSVYRHGNATFTFVMDVAHNGDPIVWWDPSNALNKSANATVARDKGLSTSNRVLPPILTVTLIGLTPQYREDHVTPVTTRLTTYNNNDYHYIVEEGNPEVSLALTATGAVGSQAKVILSTVNISENPQLYASNEATATIIGAEFTNLTFGTSPLPLGLNKTTTFSFTYVDGLVVPITVSFDGLTLDGNTGTNALFTDNGDGTYTFTPDNASTRTWTFSLKSTKRFSACSVTLSHEDYNEATLSVSRPTSFVLTSGSSLAAGTRRPSSNRTYVYAYYKNTYSDSDYVNNSSYSTRFTTENLYTSRDNVTITLSKWGDGVEDGVVYFRYNGNDSNGANGYHYAQVSLADLYDTVIENGQRYTLNFRRAVTGQTASFSAGNFNGSTSYTNNTITMTLDYFFEYTTYNNTGYIYGESQEYFNILHFTCSRSDYEITRVVFNCLRRRSGNSYIYHYPSSDYTYAAVEENSTIGSYTTSNGNNTNNSTGTWTGTADRPLYFFMSNDNDIYIYSVTVTYQYYE